MTAASKSKDKPKRYPIAEDVIEDWLRDSDVRANTARMYRYGMRALQDYVLERGLDMDQLKKSDIIDFKLSLQERLSPSAVSTYLAGVRSYYRWAENDAQPDLAHSVKGAKIAKGFKKDVLSVEQAKLLLNSIDRTELIGLRDYAIINLMLRTALRDIEVVRADVNDMRCQAGVPTLYVQGKGCDDKDRFVVLVPEAHMPIKEYLKARDDDDDENPPLFVSHSYRNPGQRLTTRSVSGMIKRRLANIGIVSNRITAHSLRHTAITYSLLGGASVQEAQEMARHADINTTMVYSHNVDRLQQGAEYRISDYLDRPQDIR